VSLEGVTIEGQVLGGALHMAASATRLVVRDSTVNGLVTARSHATGRSEVVIDRSELLPGSEGASISAWAEGAPLDVTLMNSIVRGSVYTTEISELLSIEAINNTFVGGSLQLGSLTTATVVNNIFTDSDPVAWHPENTNVVLDNNGGAECRLDTRSPVPTLAADSPCRDTGDAALAPATDFLRVTRDARPDLGAVEVK
jgi:hypothetical protein